MEKLLKIQCELKANKSRRNDFGGFNYRSAEDILETVKPLLEVNKCLLTLSDELVNIGDRYYIKSTARIKDLDTNEEEEAVAYAREPASKKGMDDSQVTGSTSSYARKYALNGLFLIDDSKQDPDSNEQTERRNKAAEEIDGNQTINAKEVAKINGLLEMTGADVPAFLEYFHVKSVEEMTGSQFVEAVFMLQKKENKQEKGVIKV